MKKMILISALMMTQNVFAASGVFAGMTSGSTACYGAEIAGSMNGKVSIQKMIAKFSITSYKVKTMDVDMTLNNGQQLRSELVCDTSARCYIECDGGRVDLELLADGALKLSNATFIIAGGCGDSEIDPVTINTLGRDQFVLEKMPAEVCR